MQTGKATDVEAMIMDPLRVAAEARRASRAAKAATTKVDFFTMARGED
ncbi:phosphonate C-P lyase system protein PhnG [Tateyamaria armeniaca]|uniref:Phosphonate C-P lyase system protein PhnG n=1 Tax=Tateyamaria armeniaca TaxID=2518930 RepID=A0ABW8URZ3_9RHOB